MIQLDDLLAPEQNSSYDHLCESDGRLTYLPELIEFKEADHQLPALDPFLHHLGEHHTHHPCPLLLHPDPISPTLSPEEEEVSEELRPRRAKGVGKSRNETKNIPKNFGKGIISFIEKNKVKLRGVVEGYGFDFQEFVNYLRVQKRSINTIAELRGLWTGEMGACMRVISNLFFRKHALEYIFNSRISSYASHIKYRGSLWSALKQPETFNRIKQY